MSVPSLLSMCSMVIAEYSYGLESLDGIPDELVLQIISHCQSGEELMYVEGASKDREEKWSTADRWKKLCEEKWNKEELESLCQKYPYKLTSNTYWKKIYMSGCLEEELNKSNDDKTEIDWDNLDRFIDACNDYVHTLVLNKAKMDVIVKVLEKMKKLSYLDLSRGIGDPKLGVEGGKTIAKFLEDENCPLITLKLNNAEIGDAGCVDIAKALEKNKRIAQLDLQWNDIEDNGCRKIAAALLKNTSLCVIDMRKNNNTMRGRNELKQVALKIEREQPGRRLKVYWI